MYVKKLRINGVRGFYESRAVDLDFTRPNGEYAGWTVIAGRNGSGKTALLQAIALCAIGEKRASLLDSQLEEWLSLGYPRGEIGLWLELDDGQQNLLPDRPDVYVEWQPEQPTLFDDDYQESIAATEVVFGGLPTARALWSSKQPRGWFLAGYGPFRRLAGTEADWSTSRNVRRELGSNRRLQGVASVRTLFQEDAALAEAVSWLIQLHHFELEGREEFSGLLENITRIMDDGLLPDEYTVHDIDADGLWLERGQSRTDMIFPLRQMSHGQRTVVALVLDIVRRIHSSFGELQIEERDGKAVIPYPGVVLIDEVDAHLHVSWQQRIGPWLKEHFPKIQFIVTSHSPYICQAADEGGLIRLPGPDVLESPERVTGELYRRVVYGTGDDAVLSELFGLDTAYSEPAQELRRELASLERDLVRGNAGRKDVDRIQALKHRLSSSPVSRADEVSARVLGEGAGAE